MRFNVADGPADFRNDHVRTSPRLIGLSLTTHNTLDFIGDVRNHLHRIPEILPPAFLSDHRRINLARRRISRTRQIHIEKALVVSDIQIGFRAILCDKNLTMLEGVHRTRVHVDVRIQLLHDNMKASRA